MDAFVHDVRYALRVLRQRPGVTLVVLLTLSIGIGANTAIFSFADAILLRPLPYANADRIVGIWERRPSGQATAMSALNYLDYARESGVFAHIAATTVCCGPTLLGGEPYPTPLASLKVSASYFDVFGAKAAYGRTFAAGDDQPGHDQVVVLSHRVWASRFGSDPTLIGRTIRLDERPFTVIGVMPENSPFDRGFIEIWVPVSFDGERRNRGSHWLLSLSGGALGLLKPGISIEKARAEMDTVAARLSIEYPDTNKGWGVVLEPYENVVANSDLRRSLYLAVAAVVLVLLIACVNIANVLLAWALAREREIVLRLALGAAPTRLLRQFLTESLLLSTVGGGLGVVVGYGTMSLLRTILRALPATVGTLPILLPADVAVQLDGRVLSFAVGVSVLCGAVFGLAPALTTIHGMRATIASGARASATATHRRLRHGLIVAQVALAFLMLIGAGLLIRSFEKMRTADTGFNATNVLTVQLSRSERHFATPSQVRTFMREVVAGLRATPGIVDAAFVDGMPMNGAPRGTFFQRAADPLVERAQRPLADLKIVGPGYFHVLGLHVRRGRTLSEIDRDKSPLVAVINETLARMFFASGDPIGQRLLMDGPTTTSTNVAQTASYEIVGVIADERLTPFDDRRAHPVVYVSNEQNPRDFVGVIVRTSLDGQRLESAVRATVAAADRGVAATQVRTMDQWLSESMTPDRYRSVLFGALAAVAALLAAIGIYGVVSYSVAQRTREIGIRAALGATPGKLVRLVVSEGVTLAAIGLALGAAAAVGLTRILDAFLFGIERSDAITWLAAVTVLGSVAVVGCYIPARRAASVDPLVALRAE